jgi:hypothetical protein
VRLRHTGVQCLVTQARCLFPHRPLPFGYPVLF